MDSPYSNFFFLYMCSWIAGPIPEGADAVVQVEDTEEVTSTSDGLKRVKILTRVTEGHDIRNVVLSSVFRLFLLFFKLLVLRIA